MTGSRKGTPVRDLDKGARGRQLAKGNASDQSTPEQRDQSDEMRSRAVREDESAFQ